MTIRVALKHVTEYKYNPGVILGPQVVRLKPAAHCRTPIEAYSLSVAPDDHFCNWLQDPSGNFLARYVFPELTDHFRVEVNLVADLTVINPFDFFLEPYAEHYPFKYSEALEHEIAPYLLKEPVGPKLQEWLEGVDRSKQHVNDFIVSLNQRVCADIDYVIRMEPGIQSCEETLTKRRGSCRDSAWLLVQILRNCGLAARFASGYSIQLKPDVKAVDGPSGVDQDVCDLHAWAEVFLPGAGWVGMDATSGLLTGEGHLPLCCSPDPTSAAPITGGFSGSDETEQEFHFEMEITRLEDIPRVTKPYSEEAWKQIDAVGEQVDADLQKHDVRLTMGGEPTFVSIDDMEGEEWSTAAVGPTKRDLSEKLIRRLAERFAGKGLLHFGQGKWYPGESLPRWAMACYWRTDGEPLWENRDLIAKEGADYGHGREEAEEFITRLTERLDLSPAWIQPVYEDALHYIWKEQKLPPGVDPLDSDLKDPEERDRLARVFGRGLDEPVGYMLPVCRQWWQAQGPRWLSGKWPIRSERLFLVPGDSPIGLRLPLDSLAEPRAHSTLSPVDPSAITDPLPGRPQMQQRHGEAAETRRSEPKKHREPKPEETDERMPIHTAMCVEPRDGRIHLFMPPVNRTEDYVELLAAAEATAAEMNAPIVVEGYLPPHDPRIEQIKVTPDPGVIEVNVQPSASWKELKEVVLGVYEDARQTRLGSEKFDLDGRHTGTGGGNHVVIGGRTPLDSPFLRRPDLLKSLIGYWNNHPSLSYLFSGTFMGPTSQAPRVDEGRRDSVDELELAFAQVPAPPVGEVVSSTGAPPWLADRLFRDILTDLTGNTHRAEFCIDKLYSPDSSTGRLGLLELRAMEMPPSATMSLVQQLLIRALISRFWQQPYQQPLVHWDTILHDRFLLGEFVRKDFMEVLGGLKSFGYDLDPEWFESHLEFRFPKIGMMECRGMRIELRQAIEPWFVLGEEPAGGGTARYVDSSVERLQVKVTGYVDTRYQIACNGFALPMSSTGTMGEYVAGVRYRAWQPPRCLHPTIGVDTPLVFDVIDTWNNISVSGCTYHVSHPGGLSYDTFPVNSYEAESRRVSRFFEFGMRDAPQSIQPVKVQRAHPLTLDLRRSKSA
jgi:uncharacterized protein (DUF2126 family)/transglutaminase-like putative cysteine protease